MRLCSAPGKVTSVTSNLFMGLMSVLISKSYQQFYYFLLLLCTAVQEHMYNVDHTCP